MVKQHRKVQAKIGGEPVCMPVLSGNFAMLRADDRASSLTSTSYLYGVQAFSLPCQVAVIDEFEIVRKNLCVPVACCSGRVAGLHRNRVPSCLCADVLGAAASSTPETKTRRQTEKNNTNKRRTEGKTADKKEKGSVEAKTGEEREM